MAQTRSLSAICCLLVGGGHGVAAFAPSVSRPTKTTTSSALHVFAGFRDRTSEDRDDYYRDQDPYRQNYRGIDAYELPWRERMPNSANDQGIPAEPVLWQYAQNGNWDEVYGRVCSHPEEAAFGMYGWTPLHLIVAGNGTPAPLRVVRAVYAAFPEALEIRTESHRRTPFDIAVHWNQPQSVIDFLADPNVLELEEGTGMEEDGSHFELRGTEDCTRSRGDDVNVELPTSRSDDSENDFHHSPQELRNDDTFEIQASHDEDHAGVSNDYKEGSTQTEASESLETDDDEPHQPEFGEESVYQPAFGEESMATVTGVVGINGDYQPMFGDTRSYRSDASSAAQNSNRDNPYAGGTRRRSNNVRVEQQQRQRVPRREVRPQAGPHWRQSMPRREVDRVEQRRNGPFQQQQQRYQQQPRTRAEEQPSFGDNSNYYRPSSANPVEDPRVEQQRHNMPRRESRSARVVGSFNDHEGTIPREGPSTRQPISEGPFNSYSNTSEPDTPRSRSENFDARSQRVETNVPKPPRSEPVNPFSRSEPYRGGQQPFDVASPAESYRAEPETFDVASQKGPYRAEPQTADVESRAQSYEASAPEVEVEVMPADEPGVKQLADETESMDHETIHHIDANNVEIIVDDNALEEELYNKQIMQEVRVQEYEDEMHVLRAEEAMKKRARNRCRPQSGMFGPRNGQPWNL